MTVPERDAWLPTDRRDARGRLRLFCFPYAGGGASLFRPWADALPASIALCPIQLPGREGRMSEAPYDRLEPLVADVVTVLRDRLDSPFALFGHSLGGLIAFETARAIRRAGLRAPARLFVSAFRAPHLPDAAPPLHALPGPSFREELARLNGTPAEILESRELMRLLEPTLRADFAVHETYAHAPGEPLDCPISVFGGDEDREVDRGLLAAWRRHTRGPFTLRLLPGDHFFIHTSRVPLLEALVEDLRPLLGGAAQSSPR